MTHFKEYSHYYDLLYKDKDYQKEVSYISDLIRKLGKENCELLDIGCGTGKHANLLVDKGYKGHKQAEYQVDIESGEKTRPPWNVLISGQKSLTSSVKKELKRRSAIEPIIGHLKADHRMGRNFLKGKSGDRFNAKMAAIGFNFQRIMFTAVGHQFNGHCDVAGIIFYG